MSAPYCREPQPGSFDCNSVNATASPFTFHYRTSYRFYFLAKIGFGSAYLWYISDFFRIHLAIWNQLSLLLSAPVDIVFSGNPHWDNLIRVAAIFLNGKMAVWILFLTSPIAVGIYLWGRHRRLQFVVGCWMSFSMISLTALAGVFVSAADIWLNCIFVFYSLAALLSSADLWEKNEGSFSKARWKHNADLASLYAWFMVLLQFSVYFFAGVNKLIDGWSPWTTGAALQNLAFDSSMREFVRGTRVPLWISLVLCYFTLFQRLIVPFGFYFQRYRLWSVFILGSMHIGYAILMHVNLFPLVGIASLLMVLPAGKISLNEEISRKKKKKQLVAKRHSLLPARQMAVCFFSLMLIAESTRLTVFKPVPWENKLMIVPAWKMFADGGISAGGKWRIILSTPTGEVDATDLSLQPLPHIWRDRFYVDTIFHDVAGNNVGPNSLVDRLLKEAGKAYADHQTQLHGDATVLGSAFDLYRRSADSAKAQPDGFSQR